jgi:hypothetical protein
VNNRGGFFFRERCANLTLFSPRDGEGDQIIDFVIEFFREKNSAELLMESTGILYM